MIFLSRALWLTIGVVSSFVVACCLQPRGRDETIEDGHYAVIAEGGEPHEDLELQIDGDELVVSYDADDGSGRISLVFRLVDTLVSG